MLFQQKKILFAVALICLIIILLISHKIRSLRYDTVPYSSTIQDERTHIWTGLSVRNTGVPAAWSDVRAYFDYWPQYQTEINNNKITTRLDKFNITANDRPPAIIRSSKFPELILYTVKFDYGQGDKYISVMQPFLDYPPLGGVILSTSIPIQKDNYQDVLPIDYRQSSLWLALITLVLIFVLGSQIFNNYLIALFSAAVYATAPTFVLASRYTLLENVLIPSTLLSLNILVFAINNLSKQSLKYRVCLMFAGGVAGLAFLIKPTGIAVTIAGVATLILYKERFKNLLFYLIPALGVSSLYIIYGYLLAPHIFTQILIEQSSKRLFAGSLSSIAGFFKFGIKEFPIDGYWVGGFISLLFLKYTQRTIPLIASIIAFLFVILFMGGSFFPWYTMPMIPFMALGIGYLLWEVVTNPKINNILIVFLFFFLSSFFWGYGVHGAAPGFINHEQQYFFYKICLSLAFIAAVFGPTFYHRSSLLKRIWIIGAVLFICGLMYLNYKSIYYIVGTWGHLSEHYPHNWSL